MAEHITRLKRWVADQLQACFATAAPLPSGENQLEQWQIVSGDASFRRYFRTSYDGNSYVVMDAPPDKEALAPFIDVATRLREAGIRAPKIFAEDRHRGFMLLEDFGDEMVKAQLEVTAGQPLFDRILPVLTAMVNRCRWQGLPVYSSTKLGDELQLLIDWYIGRHRGCEVSDADRRLWQQLCELLIDSAHRQPQAFVHRDFHSCNLHVLSDGETGVIDFQDAVYGPVSYDLASWLWDRYIDWPRASIEAWMLQARPSLAPGVKEQDWIRYCDFMGLQRNLKIIGIFARLHYRDNKPGYLEMIPQFVAYVIDVLPRYPELSPYQQLLDGWLSKQPVKR